METVAPLAGSVDRNLVQFIDTLVDAQVAPLAGSVDRNRASKNTSMNKSASLPSRGAWIEIQWTSGETISLMSLPSRGAWIEIERNEFFGR